MYWFNVKSTKLPCSSMAVAPERLDPPVRLHLPQAALPPQQHLPLLLHLHNHRHRLRKVRSLYGLGLDYFIHRALCFITEV